MSRNDLKVTFPVLLRVSVLYCRFNTVLRPVPYRAPPSTFSHEIPTRELSHFFILFPAILPCVCFMTLTHFDHRSRFLFLPYCTINRSRPHSSLILLSLFFSAGGEIPSRSKSKPSLVTIPIRLRRWMAFVIDLARLWYCEMRRNEWTNI